MGYNLDVNYVAVLVSGIAAMIIGGLWYSPILFGNIWTKLSGFTKKDIAKAKKQGGMGASYFVTFIGTLVTAFVLSVFVNAANANTATAGAFIGFLAWLGFNATEKLSMVLWECRPFSLYVLNTAHGLVTLVVMGSILAVY